MYKVFPRNLYSTECHRLTRNPGAFKGIGEAYNKRGTNGCDVRVDWEGSAPQDDKSYYIYSFT